ncbi:MAG TPA: FHA domain-containing protein [Bacillota bacterium]
MRKFLNLINIPKHIKNYILFRKLESYESKQNTFWIFIIDLLILALFLTSVYFIYFVNQNKSLKKAGLIGSVTLVVGYLIKISGSVNKYEQKYDGIRKLILKDDDGRNVKVWNIENKTALLVGKKSRDNDVDIDLSDTQYAALVSKQHAVLNFSGNCWYIEDLGSTNGSGIKRFKDKTRFKLEQGKPYRLNIGDLIYIANIKILVK